MLSSATKAAVGLLACCLLTLGTQAAQQPLVLPYGVSLDELPGAASILGSPSVKNTSITLVDAPVMVSSS